MMLCKQAIVLICGLLSVIIIVIVYFSDTFINNFYTSVVTNFSVRTFKTLSVETLSFRVQSPGCNYVGFTTNKRKLNRLGNYMFYYAGVLYVSWRTGRRPCIWKSRGFAHRHLDEVFDLDIEYIDHSKLRCPLHVFNQRGIFTYDKRVESLISVSENKSLLIHGAFQSWRYTYLIATQLRLKLRFRREIMEFAVDFLHMNVPAGWNTHTFVRVGVHVRRGDFLEAWPRKYGFVVADEQYLQRAMNYFVERYQRVQFIVASDDMPWCQKHIKPVMLNKTDINITFSVNHNAGQDLALLANCDHTVMTTGTYSWWAAFLANGTTVYYSNSVRRGSRLAADGHNSDYYHPDWIGFGG